MDKSSKIYSYIFIFLGAAAIFAAEVVRSAPRQIEGRLLEEIKVIAYIDKSASAEDLNNFSEEISSMDLFSVQEIKTSAAAFRELKEDETIAAQLEAIEREFSPPHSVILGIKSLNGSRLKAQIAQIESKTHVEYVDLPGALITGASKFLKRIESLSLFLTVVFSVSALLLIFISALFYYYAVSKLLRMGVDMGASFIKILSPALKRQFLAGLLGGIFASGFFYAAGLFYEINIFSYETAAWVSGGTGLLSLPSLGLIYLIYLKD